MKARKYTLKRRAADQEVTRQRIVEAAMQLHEEIGPRATTISAIADRAGVQRLTVYRHFPDDLSLFRACSSRWLDLNPPPDPGAWAAKNDAHDRTRAALTALYRYYADTAGMWERVYRDADVPAMQEPLASFHAYLDAIAVELTASWQPAGRRPKPLAATVRHCLEFSTWQSLMQRGLRVRQAAKLATSWIQAARRSTA